MEVFIVVISVVLSAVVSILVRSLDKKGDPLAKIRNYADKRQSMFDEYFKSKNKEIQLGLTDLKEHQFRAVGAVDAFKKQISTFEAQTKTLSDKINAVNKIESKIDHYDKVLGELIEMTAAVEQNLQKIKNEANIIDKFNARISAQDKQVGVIEKKVEQIVKQFSSQNKEQIKELGENLLAQFQARADKIDETTKVALNQNKEVMVKINSEIKNAFDEAAKRAKNIQDTAFANLTENYNTQINSVTGRIMDDINSRTSEIAHSAKVKIEELNKVVEASFDETNRQTRVLEQQTRGNSDRLEAVQNAIEKQAEQLASRYDSIFENAISKAQNQENAAYEKYNKISTVNLDKYKNSFQNKVNEMQSFLAKMVGDVQNSTEILHTNMEQSFNGIRSDYSAAEAAAQETAARIEEQSKQSSVKLAELSNTLQEQLKHFDSVLATAMKGISEDYESKQNKFLAGLDKQLSVYKKDIEYKFKRLETAGSDADKLEENLRKFMDAAQKRVISDFDKFGENQAKKQKEFLDSLNRNSQEIQTQLNEVEQNLEELKEKAYGNVSAKLQDFVEEFNNDLARRENSINEELSAWKNNFDSKINQFTNDYEESRREIELNYSEELNRKISEYASRSLASKDQIEQQMEETKSTVREELDNINQNLKSFIEQYKVELQNTTATADTLLKRETDEFNIRVKDSLLKCEQDLGQQISDFKQAMIDKQESSTSVIDSSISEFNTWKRRISDQFEEKSGYFNEQLESLKQKNDIDFKDLSAQTKELGDALKMEIQDLADKARNTISEFDEDSIQMRNTLESSFETLKKDTDKYILGVLKDTDKDMLAYKKDFKSITSKFNDESNDIQIRFDEINKTIAKFVKDSEIFEKAENHKKQLTESLTELKQSLSQVKDWQDEVKDLEARVKNLDKMNADVTQKISLYNNERGRVDRLEQDYTRIIQLSSKAGQTLDNIIQANDTLQDVEMKVRDFQENLADISNKFERIEKKEVVIDKVSDSVDKAFENLKALEQRLTECKRETNSLPKEILQVQKDVDSLLKNSGKISNAIEKLDSLQHILDDTDEHINSIKNSRDGILTIEASLKALAKETDKKIDIVKAISEPEAKKKTNVSKVVGKSEKDMVIDLKRRGWKDETIANKLGLSISEVRLILEMER